MRIELHGKDGVRAIETPDIDLDDLVEVLCDHKRWTRCGEGCDGTGCGDLVEDTIDVDNVEHCRPCAAAVLAGEGTRKPKAGLNKPFRGECRECLLDRVLIVDDPAHGARSLCVDCLIAARKERDKRDATPDCSACHGEGWVDGTGMVAGQVVTCPCVSDRRTRELWAFDARGES